MKLKNLIKDIGVKAYHIGWEEVEAKGVSIDHRNVKAGDVFIALKGENFDGNNFAREAVEKGAVAVISQYRLDMKECFMVDNPRSAYALISKHFYDDACDKLKIIGVTGTNGKTTVCNTIADILRAAGHNVGVIGTMGATVGKGIFETGMTTPDPEVLHKIFKKMYEEGKEYVVMEASAHALALNKLDGITFEVGVLTNITEDHLDFFGNMESYANAKYKLFEKGRTRNAIICKGNGIDEEFLSKIEIPCQTYSLELQHGADISAEVLKSDLSGSEFLCKIPQKSIPIKIDLVGLYNIENALASIGVCLKLGLRIEQIQRGAKCALPVEGRFNVLRIGGLNIIIDFAHTPDGIEKVLTTAKELIDGKLIVIFGCGGNRDRQKRPIMGEIASRIADEIVLTSDNPRFEEPMDIIREILDGVSTKNLAVVPDRRHAIEYVLSKYSNGETIVIAGKGGEKYQDIQGIKYPYNDFDVVNDFFRMQLLNQKFSKKGIEKEGEGEIEI